MRMKKTWVKRENMYYKPFYKQKLKMTMLAVIVMAIIFFAYQIFYIKQLQIEDELIYKAPRHRVLEPESSSSAPRTMENRIIRWVLWRPFSGSLTTLCLWLTIFFIVFRLAEAFGWRTTTCTIQQLANRSSAWNPKRKYHAKWSTIITVIVRRMALTSPKRMPVRMAFSTAPFKWGLVWI